MPSEFAVAAVFGSRCALNCGHRTSGPSQDCSWEQGSGDREPGWSTATATAMAYQLSAILQLHKLEKDKKIKKTEQTEKNNYNQQHKYGDWPTEMAVAVASDK